MIDRSRFFSGYRETFGSLDQSLVDSITYQLDRLEGDDTMDDRRMMAYFLATDRHETAGTFQPIEERGNIAYFDKYEPSTRIGKNLGNTQRGDGYRFRGRGGTQLTGRANYEKFGDLLELPLLQRPDLALDPVTSYRIMSIGMVRGLFTGKKMSDYINKDHCDFYNCRRVVNGTDKASLIACYARAFQVGLAA